MIIYLIEALEEWDRCSAIKSWKSKIKHKPEIKRATTRFLHKQGHTLEAYSREVSGFVQWLTELRASNNDELVVLWLSVHGAKTKTGIKFDNGDENSMFEVLRPLDIEMENVVLLQSICWGSLPTISFAMNKKGRGPKLVFGSTLEVKIPKLHYAEIEILKLLAVKHNPSLIDLSEVVGSINEWGNRQIAGYERYYRVWFWGDNDCRPDCYPRLVSNRPKLVINMSQCSD